jgi:hypothetical protein
MMSGPNNATAQVKEKSGGTTTSGINMRSNLVTLRSATGVVDSCRYNGLSDQLSKLSGVEATFKLVLVVNETTARPDEEATKAEATEQSGKKRTTTFMIIPVVADTLENGEKNRLVSTRIVCSFSCCDGRGIPKLKEHQGPDPKNTKIRRHLRANCNVDGIV